MAPPPNGSFLLQVLEGLAIKKKHKQSQVLARFAPGLKKTSPVPSHPWASPHTSHFTACICRLTSPPQSGLDVILIKVPLGG